MENWGAKVTQMAGVTLEPLKPKPITITDPTRCPGSPQARPGAAHRVRNTHEEEGSSSRAQLVRGPITPGRATSPAVAAGPLHCTAK